MKVFFYALFFHLTFNLYVFWRGWQTLAPRKGFRTVFATLFAAEFLVYLAGVLFWQQMPDGLIRAIAFVGTTWMLFVFYLAVLLLITDVVFWIHKRKPFLFGVADRHPRYTRATVFGVMTLSVIAVLWLGNAKFNRPVVVRNQISIAKNATGLDSLRIVMVGDTHFGYLINRPFAKKYVDLIMEQHPDLILFVGDVVDAGLKPLLDERLGDELRRLHAPLGIYSCTGNHEYRYEAEEKIRWINQYGITVLRDSAVLVADAFYIVGREDTNAPFIRKPLSEILSRQHIDLSKPIIVLNHNPRHLRDEVAAQADLALYGHTHSGQFFPGNIITGRMYEVAHGYKKIGDTHVHVTSGLGLAGPQYRIGTQSEIVVLEVKFGEN